MKLETKHVDNFIVKDCLIKFADNSLENNSALHNKTKKGSDYLGWVNLPFELNSDIISDIEKTASDLRTENDVIVVIGIGGSYLGAKAVIEALSKSFVPNRQNIKPMVVFAGNNISEDYLYELCEFLKDKSYSVIVISKSGTTTEPAVAFRILKKDLYNRYKNNANKRIVVITDKKKGALKQLADMNDYKTFVIPNDVGGRFSVLTPVGLLPIAVAGFDIKQLIDGAKNIAKQTGIKKSFDENIAAKYALIRNLLYKNNYNIEVLVNYNPKLKYFAEWWKQLYGESEGKEGKGIFPASASFTTDLHSIGQYIQDGIRNIFETVISVKEPDNKLLLPSDYDNLDNLNYLAGRRIDHINKSAELGTKLAHVEGGVPNITIEIQKINEYCIGELIYFFEKACGISGYLLDVNPFDQPGVETYKTNMFKILGKPGY